MDQSSTNQPSPVNRVVRRHVRDHRSRAQDIGSLSSDMLSMIVRALGDGEEDHIGLDEFGYVDARAIAKAQRWHLTIKAMSEVNRHWHVTIAPQLVRRLVIRSARAAELLAALVADGVVSLDQTKQLIVSWPRTGTDRQGEALRRIVSECTQLERSTLNVEADPELSGNTLGIFAQENGPATIHMATSVTALTLNQSAAILSPELASGLRRLSINFSSPAVLDWLGNMRFSELVSLDLGFDRFYFQGRVEDYCWLAPKLRHLALRSVYASALDKLLDRPPPGHCSLRSIYAGFIDYTAPLRFIRLLPDSVTSLTLASTPYGPARQLRGSLSNQTDFRGLQCLRLHNRQPSSPEQDSELRSVCARASVDCDFQWLWSVPPSQRPSWP